MEGNDADWRCPLIRLCITCEAHISAQLEQSKVIMILWWRVQNALRAAQVTCRALLLMYVK